MKIIQGLAREIKELGLLTIYFSVWFGMIVFAKWLVLAEYHIEIEGASLALVGALIVAKVVIVLEHVSLGQWVRHLPVIVDVLLRTLIYSLGVLILLLLERAFELRVETGGIVNALVEEFRHREIHHVAAETICVAGSLLGFNVLSVVKRHFGGNELRRLFFATSMADLESNKTDMTTAALAKDGQ